VALELPSPDGRWRCARCGNLTRFDVTRTTKVREYWHLDLSGEPTVEQSETLSATVERVACRWCGADDAVEVVARPEAGEEGADTAALGGP
jgi:hypothetical protein